MLHVSPPSSAYPSRNVTLQVLYHLDHFMQQLLHLYQTSSENSFFLTYYFQHIYGFITTGQQVAKEDLLNFKTIIGYSFPAYAPGQSLEFAVQ